MRASFLFFPTLKIVFPTPLIEQKKYDLKLSGGDTTNSNKVSFSVTTVGFSNKIIERNKAKLNDDIYVTGNLGDSYFLNLKGLFLPKPIPEAGFNSVLLIGIIAIVAIIFLVK